jgi:hypothetical protein
MPMFQGPMSKAMGYKENEAEPMMPEASTEDSATGAKPPNLREVMMEAPICGTCDHFSGSSCKKFNGYPVEFHEGCDAHSDLSADEEPAESAEETRAPEETEEEQ